MKCGMDALHCSTGVFHRPGWRFGEFDLRLRARPSGHPAVAGWSVSLRSAGEFGENGERSGAILECGGKRQRDTAFAWRVQVVVSSRVVAGSIIRERIPAAHPKLLARFRKRCRASVAGRLRARPSGCLWQAFSLRSNATALQDRGSRCERSGAIRRPGSM
jgi:hypothetical protein